MRYVCMDCSWCGGTVNLLDPNLNCPECHGDKVKVMLGTCEDCLYRDERCTVVPIDRRLWEEEHRDELKEARRNDG